MAANEFAGLLTLVIWKTARQYLKIAFASYAALRYPAQSSSHTPQIKAAEGRLILPRPEPATSKVQLDGTTANELNDRIPATQTNPGWAVSSPTTTISAISIVIWALFLLFCCYFPNLVERKNQPS